jgi:tripartite-type tricarboxylate transporter receptor subunit TctC
LSVRFLQARSDRRNAAADCFQLVVPGGFRMHSINRTARHGALFVGALILQGAASLPVSAQSFPNKPIRIIASTSPGGITDLLARSTAQLVGASLGQPVVVENRPGAGTLIGMSMCAKSPPDGYTLCITDNQSLVYNPLLFKKLPYDPDSDFTAVTALARNFGSAIVAPASLPASSFKEVLAYGKAHPGAVNFATWGPGSIPAIYYSWITRQNSVDLTAIPYKGAGPSLIAVTSGQVDLAYSNIGIAQPMVQAGKLKILAVTGSVRHPDFPDVPSLGELNSDPGMDNYFGIFAPAKTPRAIVERLSAEFAKAMRSAQLQTVAKENFLQVVGNTPDEFAGLVKNNRATAAHVFKTLGIEPSDAPGDAPAQTTK